MATGEKIFRVRQSCHWWIGDWLNYGEAAYGEKYAQAIDETKYSYYTLAHDKTVAARVESCRRRQNLSWSHHAEVASLTPAKQDELLDLAEANSWSREDLRDAVRAAKSDGANPSIEQERIVETDIDDESMTVSSTQWRIMVECENEEKRDVLLERFRSEGLKCEPLNG